jgi:hypothetical protein
MDELYNVFRLYRGKISIIKLRDDSTFFVAGKFYDADDLYENYKNKKIKRGEC